MRSSNSARLLKYCKTGNIKKIKELLFNPDINLDINFQDVNGNSSLIWASRNGNVAVVRLLLLGNKSNENMPFDINNYLENHNKKHFLFNGNKPGLETNIENVSINMTNIHGNTALTWACREGYTDIAKLLLAHGADPTIINNAKYKALTYACKNDHEEIVKILLDSDIDNKDDLGINLKSGTYNYTPLIYACKIGNEKIAKALLENGADVNIQNIDGDTALIWACKNQHQSVVELLLCYNALTYLKNNRGFTSFSWALYKKNKVIFKLLHDNLLHSLLSTPTMNYDNGTMAYVTPPLTPTMSVTTLPGYQESNTFLNSNLMNNTNIAISNNIGEVNKDPSNLLFNPLSPSSSTTTVISTSNLNGMDNQQIQPSSISSLSFTLPKSNMNNKKIASYSCETTQVVTTTTLTTTRLSFSFNNEDSNSVNGSEEPLIVSQIEETSNKRSSLLLENIKKKNMNIELTASQSKIEVGNTSDNNNIEIVTKNVGGKVNFSNSLNRMIINLGRSSSNCSDEEFANRTFSYSKYGNRNMAIVNEDKNSYFIQGSSSCIDQNSERCFSIMKREYFLSTDEASFPCLTGFVEYVKNNEKRAFFRRKTKFSLTANEKDNIDLLQKLIDYGVNISNRLFNGSTALIISCIYGQEKFFQFLIDQNVDVNVPNSENWTALMVASQNCQMKMIQQLLQQNANTNYQNNYQETALIIASKEGHLEVVNKLLKFFSKVNNKDNFGDAALLAACRNGHISIVKVLLENNADINIQNNYGETAVMVATKYNNLEIFQLLLDFNANIDMQNINGWTALAMACYYGYENIVKCLIKHKADITIKDKENKTAYEIAEKRQFSNITRLLEKTEKYKQEKKEQGGNYSKGKEEEEEENYFFSSESEWDSDSDGDEDKVIPNDTSLSSPLIPEKSDASNVTSSEMITPTSSQIEIVSDANKMNDNADVKKNETESNTNTSKLKKRSKSGKRKYLSLQLNNKIGASFYQKIGWSKLHILCMNGDIKQLNKLIDEGKVDLNEKTVDGWSALHIAVSNNKYEVVECLIHHGIDKNIENDHYSPLYIASQNGFNDIVKLLVDHGADIDKVTDDWSAIQIACSNGHYQTVEYLLSQGADIHLKTIEEYKLLHIATEENNLCMVELLLNKGHVNVNAKNSGGWTALHIVARENFYGLAKYLIRYGHADVDEEDNNMNTPLHIASQYGNHTIAQLLIHHNANINFKNLNGWTPLHIACQNEHTEVVRDLLENGAKVNLTTHDSKTALHIACENDNKNVIQLLMDHKVNINLSTFDGWTALHFAVYYNNPMIVEYLLESHPTLHKKNNDGLTVLDIAYKMKNEDIIKLLIDYFLKMDEKANKTLLLSTFNKKEEEKKKERDEKREEGGKKKKEKEEEEEDLCHDIIVESEVLINEIKKNNFIHAVNIIESQKVALEYIDQNGWTALHWASYKGSSEVVKKLIDNNVKLQKKTKNGIRHQDDLKGKTAKEIAEKKGHYNVVDIIQNKIYKKRANIALNILSKATEFVSDKLH
ncbi:ankyrin [Piromyces finnis]|uniref:Ankyrin n=1 Tax=Piromyces finnis TaxID=1754191 RepID=A0A1Y1VL11_9FUNG|nr:ankyrin [Piromyces finnis]|eukprot:ORX59112.1 ankyrin [Piromyces finnis]